MNGNIPCNLVAGVGDGFFQLLRRGLGGVRRDALLRLGVEIFAAEVRHVGGWF